MAIYPLLAMVAIGITAFGATERRLKSSRPLAVAVADPSLATSRATAHAPPSQKRSFLTRDDSERLLPKKQQLGLCQNAIADSM